MPAYGADRRAKRQKRSADLAEFICHDGGGFGCDLFPPCYLFVSYCLIRFGTQLVYIIGSDNKNE